MKYQNVLETVGSTPHIRLTRLFPDNIVWLKDERRNPGGSIKDRIAVAMIEDAEKKGLLKPGGVIVEPTSGNTGIGLAMVGAVKGYRVVLVMPETMSLERRMALKAYGAEIELTPGSKGMRGAIEKAEEIETIVPGAWMPKQFENPVNPNTHALITAKEIEADFQDGFDYLVAGVGSAGHINGLGSELKKKRPSLKVVAVEPFDSPVISGGIPGSHKIQGIGAGFIPKNYLSSVVDKIILIKTDEAFSKARELSAKEGILAGISTGANIAAVGKLIKEIKKDATILTLAYDIGERYFSCENLFNV